MTAALSVGVAGGLGPDAIARIARAAEAAGLSALWVNDSPEGDALAGLAAAAAVTSRLRLATGVLPVDRRSAASIADRVRDLPQKRVVLGVGSGALRTHQLAAVGEAVAALRARTSVSVMVGALGPRMRRLAARDADGPLLSWLTPDVAAEQAAEAHAERAGAHVALYVRTALEDGGVPRLRAESAGYAGFPAYAANFARLGIDPTDTVLVPSTIAERLRAYRAAVDEVVLRAMTASDDVGDYERFVARAGSLAAAD